MNKNKARILGFILCLSAAGSGQADPRGAVRDVPIDVASIGGEQLLDQGIGNVEDFLQALPGISSLNQDSAPAGTNVDLRGLGSDRTLVLINGRRFATPTTIPGATGPAEGTGIDLGSIANSIERVEVLQDGAAATFGRDAVAGVVNFVTKRDEFSFDARASYSLNDTQRIFSDYKFAIQSNEQCDATTGEANPLWSHQDKHNFGLPEFEDRGHKIYFGSTDDGYREGGFDSYGNYPSRFVSGIRVRPDPLQTFVMFDMLVDLVKNDSSISQGVKDAFFFVTGMSMMYGGADLLSDQAYMLGTFNPEDWYERLKRASAEDAGTVPTVSTPPLPPPVVETEVPAEDANLAPFDKYPYPPDYSFDFSQCTVEQRDQVIKLIRERDAARATMGYYMDYLRREGQTAEDTAEDMRQVDAAIKLRDEKNQELKDYWRSCQLPAATSQASATPATSADAQAATGDAAATAPGESNEQPGKPGSCAFDESTRFNWNLEFHVYERYRLGDGSMGSRPAQGLGLDVFERDDDLDLEIPFISPRMYFDYKAFSDRRPRTFTDSTGRACVPLDKVSPQFYLSPDMLRE
ncbi:MAG: TonB-dependent receptor plug domain-containing protein, partial [Woeseiaceae bacterium]|nr:TonB-dependent receptor plug domain-containing protein [Woeseiaceae bacterium]